LAVVAVCALMLGGCGGDDDAPNEASTAVTAGRAFLDQYVEGDGRVVRRDEGGDTVSEGQAYGMLVAVAVDDRDRFHRIWQWTRTHLSRPDGLLSWHWKDGKVVDAESAADADLDAARALVLAGDRYADPRLRADGLALARAIVERETVQTGAGRVLTAGSWAPGSTPYAVNPSYLSPRSYDLLRSASGDARYDELRDGSRAVVQALLGKGKLPPDWARLDPNGNVTAAAGADGGASGDAVFGLDAARLPARLAESCDPDDRAMAARLRPVLTDRSQPGAGKSTLDGQPIVDWQHPVPLVAAAASAVDDRAERQRLLDRAAALQREHPTYYGAAWVALGRLMLTTSHLGDC
jgi:endoglucanase